MVELAFYPAVALIYFFGVLQANKEGRVDLPQSASVNVFCLFVLMQPLCLFIGGYTGMATFLITAILSYNCLHWKDSAGSSGASEPAGKKNKKKKSH